MKKKVLCSLLGGVLVCSLTACGTQKNKRPVGGREPLSFQEIDADDIVYSDDVNWSGNEEWGADQMDADFADQYMELSIRLLQQENAQDTDTVSVNMPPETSAVPSVQSTAKKQLMWSPLCFYQSMLLVEACAGGETRGQMQDLLARGMQLKEQKINFFNFQNNLTDEKQAKLKTANEVWADSKLSLNPIFEQTAVDTYQIDVHVRPNEPETVDAINQRVSEKTKGRIPNILHRLPADGAVDFVSALFFDAKWAQKYTAGNIHENVMFHGANGAESKVTMMYSSENNYMSDDLSEGFVKPYAKGYSFAAFLPKNNMDIDTYLTKLSGSRLTALLQRADARSTIKAGIPQFTAESEISLKDALQKLGMTDAFDLEKANFSHLLAKGEETKVCVSDLFQHVKMDVDQHAKKAKESDSVKAQKCASLNGNVNVILDRPFVYAIIDQQTELPILIGVVRQL